MWCARLDRDRKETTAMKTFILDADHNITAYPSQEAASNAVPPGDAFSTAAGLRTALKNYSAATAVEIWNSLTGVTQVKKFKDGATAAKRIFAELQKLGVPDAEAAPANADTAKTKPAAAKKAKVTKKAPKPAAKPAGSGPRETSKTAQLIELLRSKDGMTLDAICKKFGWQSHTTRALMSAGGSLTKKHGLTVISEKVGDTRTYRIAK
jgi:hypothetical protein